MPIPNEFEEFDMKIRKILTIAILVVACQNQPTEARVLHVPGQYGSLGAANTASIDDDTVLVAAGTYRGEENGGIVVRRRLTWLSEEGPRETILDGEYRDTSYAFIVITSAGGSEFNGFTFYQMSSSPLTTRQTSQISISNCIFSRNSNGNANHSGAVYIVTSDEISFDHCIFEFNLSGTGGGSMLVTQTSHVRIWDCIFDSNISTRYGGGIAVISGSSADIGNCIFMYNSAGIDGGAISFTISSSGLVHNCTFYRNVAEGDNTGGGGIYKGSNSNPTVINSIFRENEAVHGAQLYQQNNGAGAGGRITISYCSVQGGVDEDANGWTGENIIDEDPLFVDGREPEWGRNGFFLDPDQSPCVDAGSMSARELDMDTLFTNPDQSLDEDTVDLGFHYGYDSFFRAGALSGQVFSALDGQPIEGVHVIASRNNETTTGARGYWEFPEHRAGDLSILFHHDDYLDTTVNCNLEENDTVEFDIRLLNTSFTPSIQMYVTTIDSGNVDVSHFTVANSGSGVLTYSGRPQLAGEADHEPWEFRTSYPVGEMTGDSRCNGCVLVDSLFWVSGANDSLPNLIYIFDREGAYIDSFEQTQNQRYGIKNMTIGPDGLVFAGEGDSVVVYDEFGSITNSFSTPVDPIECIAYDSDRDVIWICGITNAFKAVTRFGDETDYIIPNLNSFRKYGMTYWPDDPDGMGLYFVNRITVNGQPLRHTLYKLNPDEPQDTLFVAELFGEGNPQYQGAQIAKWDIFSLAFIALANVAPADGGDRIDIFHFATNTDWIGLAPLSGEINPMEQQNFTLILDLLDFPMGRYEAELNFDHNAPSRSTTIPLILNYRAPVSAGGSDSEIPVEFGIEAVYPNPFNSTVRITYSTGSAARPTRLAVYEIQGRLVTDLTPNLVIARSEETKQSVVWDASGLGSGVYIVRLEAGRLQATEKVLLIK